MPFVEDRELAAWDRLRDEGIDIVSPAQAETSQLPQIRIGFLNMMPDLALRATERQFLRLVAAGGDECLIRIRPFTISGLDRMGEARAYTEQCYDTFTDVQADDLDGLVFTGANPGESELRDEKFWDEYEQVIAWANEHIPTTMCSCLASHAVINVLHGVERSRCVPGKRWGVFSHQVTDVDHPLVADMELEFHAPRSHVHEMTAQQLQARGIKVLAFSPDADFHIAVSPDGFKWVFLQGHPEYDAVSLLKEFQREVRRFVAGERSDYPEYPQNYLSQSAKQRLAQFKDALLVALEHSKPRPVFPESEVLPSISNPWRVHGEVLFRNWIRMIVSNAESRALSPSLISSA